MHPMTRLLTSLSLLLVVAACDCSDPPTTTCTTSGECPIGNVCVEGRCEPGAPDAGAMCVDGDGDGRGEGCLQPDCDDTDPFQTGQEVCDTRDNDCDANIDEAVLSSCGDCNPLCHIDRHGAMTEHPFDLVANPNEGVRLEPDGALALVPSVRREPLPYIWISNTGEGTVSKVDTREFVEVARYLTGPLGVGNDPSRTSIDTSGNAYVGNRSGGSLTKILAGGPEGCPDRDGDGMVTTSTSGTDVLAWGTDECVAWNTALSPDPGLLRAVAAQDTIGPDGEIFTVVWAGGYGAQSAWKIDAETGAVIFRVTTPTTPYGFALDGSGNLWMASLSNQLGKIDTNICTSEATCAGPPCGEDRDGCAMQLINLPSLNYGIAVDPEQRVWLGGDRVVRYDPSAPAGARVTFGPSGTTFVNGIAADERGNIWGAAMDQGLLRIDAEDPSRWVAVPASVGMSVKGVAIDGDGKAWGINMNGRGGFGDPGALGDAIVVVPRAAFDEFTVWTEVVPTLVSPYTYSDMTGQQLRNVQSLRGSYNFVIDSCEATDDGEHVEYGELRFTSTTPEGSLIEFFARSADTRAALEPLAFVRIAETPTMASPVDLGAALVAAGMAEAQFIEIQVRLRALGSRPESPVLRNLEIDYVCPDGLT
jgi:hypothetical protein